MGEYCRILIVDDEFLMRQGMKHMLNWEQEGFQVVGEASNGEEALHMMETLRPDIVLTDIVMPVMDGMDFSAAVSRRYPGTQMIILSGYDNFEYVKNTLVNGAADYILKPTLNPEMLLAALKKAVSRIPGMELSGEKEAGSARKIERCLLGYDARPDPEIFTVCLPHSCFRMLAVDLKQVYGSSKEAIHRMKCRVRAAALDWGGDIAFRSVTLEENIFLGILNYRASRESKVMEEVVTLVGELSVSWEHTFFVLGQCFTDRERLRERYQELLPWLDYSFYQEGKCLFLAEQYLFPPEKTFSENGPLSKFDFAEYSHLLSGRRFAEAFGNMERYIMDSLERRTDPYKLKNLAKNLIYNMIIALEDCHVESEYIRKRYFVEIDEAVYASGFREVFSALKEEVLKLLNLKFGTADGVMREINGYIGEHYAEALDLKELSEIFSFNYNYLSSYFNSHNEEGFSGYLNRVRVEKACEMLKNSSPGIAEISAEAGYTDHSYFCRVFKKITGDTPSAYRRRYR